MFMNYMPILYLLLAIPSVLLLVKYSRSKKPLSLERMFYLVVISIACGIILVFGIYSWTGYFLYYAWIRISNVVAYILLITPFIVVAIFATLHKLRIPNKLLISLALVFLTVPATLWLELVISINHLYPKYVEEIRAHYDRHCSLDVAWTIALEYNRNFHNTYGKPEPKPQRYKLIFEGMLDSFETVVRTGACEDFARGLAKLLRDSLGCETRVVAFKTANHAFPEVKINGTWYVFDLTYTTPDKPVEASKYAEYLHNKCAMERRFCEVLCAGFRGLVDAVTGEDLREEHCFSTSSYATKLCYFQLRVNS
jgi:hypothetical protein